MKKNIYFISILFLLLPFILNKNLNAMEHREFTNIFLGGCESTEKMSIFAKILGYDADDFELYSPILLAKDFIENGVTNNGIEQETSSRFNEAFIWIAGEGWIDVLGTFFANPIFMSILDPQSAKDALISAAKNGHADVVKRLLENNVFIEGMERPLYSSDVQRGSELFNEFNVLIKNVLEHCTVEVIFVFLSNCNVLNLIDKEVALLAIKKSITLGQVDLLGDILPNEHIKQLFSKAEISNFLFEVEKMHGQSGYPYEQIQDILNSKKNLKRSNRCTLF